MKRILVAPLNWGLGHATRCMPLINALIKYNFEVILASDGAALKLLQKEFPLLDYLELPSYNITYPANGSNFKTKILKSIPHILKTIKDEKRVLKSYYENNKLNGIISDNRFGVRHTSVPSIYMTHQLNVLTGQTTWLSSKIHQNVISKFDECWIPDYKVNYNLSGILGHPKNIKSNCKYIGPLSRFEKKEVAIINDLMIILSGPEPQRSMLEDILIKQLVGYSGKVLFINGIIEEEQTCIETENISFYNYMTSAQLEQNINASSTVMARSGYTTIMDLAKLGKKAFFIPTPGQNEQEYLAKRLEEQFIAPFSTQDNFTIANLKEIGHYKGFNTEFKEPNFKKLFSFF